MADLGIRQAVIFAGGQGTRLRPITNTIPKPMVPIHGRPFLEYLIKLLQKNGISEVVLLLGYLPEKIVEHFGDGRAFGVNIKYSISAVEAETGQRLKGAGPLLDEKFFLMYADNYWPMDLQRMEAFHEKMGTAGMMTVYNNRDGEGEYGPKNNVRVEESGAVSFYGPASEEPGLNGIDTGPFIMSKEVLAMIPDENVSFQATVLPRLITDRQLSAFRMDHPYYFVTSVVHLPPVERFFEPKKVIFLDRDGVINKKASEHDYVKHWGEFEFLPGVLQAIKLLTEAGYQIYIFSNQRGVARGLMTENDVRDIHQRMVEEIVQAGGRIEDIYFCPHHDTAGCFCRKPQAGMLFRAAREHHLDLTKAVVIGDKPSDVTAGKAAGCRTILAEEGELLSVVQSLLRE